MYAQFYGLRESPFALTPDPRYLFMSEPHKEALASAVYGVQERKGFVLILGEVGTGKTTLIRHLLGRFGPNIRSVFVFNPAVSFTELLQLMLRDLELPCPSMRRVEMIDTLNDYLLKEAAAGRYVVIIIDEAQHLSPTVLEEVRMLSNLETARGKLIQILLVGQPELGEKLGRPELRQLRQRISLVAELKPLSYEDTVQYITHRLEVAGREGGGVFSRRALRTIYRASGGIPRLVNVICDKALVLGYGAEAPVIKAKIIREVLKDWQPFQRPATPTARPRARTRARRRVTASRPLRKIAAAVALGLAGAALIALVAGQKDGAIWSRIRSGFVPAGASGTVVSSARPAVAAPVQAPSQDRAPAPPLPTAPAALGHGFVTPPASGTPPELPPRSDVRAQPRVETPGVSASLAPPAGDASRTGPAAAPSLATREVVVASGDVFSNLVAKNYGRAELTLLDHVKSANPEIVSIDELRTGQRLRLPAYEPGKSVLPGDSNGYRLHLLTTWDPKSPVLDKLKPAVSKLGRQVFVVPVSLTPNETAYRVLVGDFPDRRDAEAFARDFRMPPGMSSQLWR
jgi:general secretion pathway protein A